MAVSGQATKVTRILGIDPGSRLTGYGVLDVAGRSMKPITQGTLRLSNTGGKAVIPLEHRLLDIYEGLTRVILEHRPTVMSIERVFFAKNAVSALKLGQARGAAILTAAIHGLDVVEYSPTEVKAAIVGHGGADKDQVARMVGLLTGAKDFATSDASDALALAICHAQTLNSRVGQARTQNTLVRRTNRRMSLAEACGVTAEQLPGKGPKSR